MPPESGDHLRRARAHRTCVVASTPRGAGFARARLAGGGPTHATNPDDPGFSRLSIFGGDTLVSRIQSGFGGGVVPGGWPNGRRFGDDVVDIAVTALISDLRTSPPIIRGPAGDNVNGNDMAFNKVFPYESTPQNGRRHAHH